MLTITRNASSFRLFGRLAVDLTVIGSVTVHFTDTQNYGFDTNMGHIPLRNFSPTFLSLLGLKVNLTGMINVVIQLNETKPTKLIRISDHLDIL